MEKLLSLMAVAPAVFVEQINAKASALDRFKKLLRYDEVSIDVGTIKGQHDPGFVSKLFHVSSLRILFLEIAHINEATVYGCRRGHRRAYQMCAAAKALPPLKVAIRG